MSKALREPSKSPARKSRKVPKIKKKHYTAKTADRHELYQRAVQDTDFEVEFLAKLYREIRGKDAVHFREDFCGTALAAAKWVAEEPTRTAAGYDFDPDCLGWGREHNLAPLGDDAKRVTLHEADVRTEGVPADIRCAHNFSYNVFHKRSELLDYFRAVRQSLGKTGVFTMDMYGGSEAVEPIEEERWIDDDFIYVWDQDEHYPGTAEHQCYIHFHFPDGSKMRRAFHYDWRLWTMPEVKDALAEVGFSNVESYFEDYDDEGDGTGEYSKSERGSACESWLAYIIAYDT